MAKRTAKAVTNGNIYCRVSPASGRTVDDVQRCGWEMVAASIPRLMREGRILVACGFEPSELCIVYDFDEATVCVMPEAVARG